MIGGFIGKPIGAIVAVGGAAINLEADAGSYTLTGVAALFRTSQPSNAATYSLTGQAATFRASMPATFGTYALTGQAALFASVAPSAAGAYTLDGQVAVLTPSLAAGAGSYAYSGVAVTFASNGPAVQGTYTLNGQAVQFPSVFPVEAGSYFYAGTDIPVTLTSAMMHLQLPIDCILAGQQHYKQSGREWEVRPRNLTEKTWGKKSSVRALRGGKPSFTSTTSKRGYD